MNVLILTTWLAPYRIDLYNELTKYAEVTVMYEMTSTPERNKEWQAKMSTRCHYQKLTGGIKLPFIGRTFPQFINEVSKHGDSYDIIYVDGYASIGLVQAINYLSKNNIHYFVNIDGALIRENESKLLTRFKKWILNRNCTYLCGAKITNKYLKSYGVKDDMIFNHPFSSLFRNDILDRPIETERKLNLREELGLQEKYIILSVGRFSYKKGYGKGYDAIIRAASRMSKDFGFYIVGDEPTEEFVKMKTDFGATNVHFVGFKHKHELKKYYQAADLFILMTIYDVWGLVINEAMSNGLPVITTNMCVAGLDLVVEGENGYIVPVGDDKTLQNRIIEMTENPEKLSLMQHAALKTIKPYTIEGVAQRHMSVFDRYLNQN